MLLLLALLACSSSKTDTSEPVDTDNPPVAHDLANGSYTFAPEAASGTCDPKSAVSGAMGNFTTLTVTVTSGGFQLDYADDFFKEYYTWVCTREVNAFTCAGDVVMLGSKSSGGDLVYEDGFTVAIAGEVTAEDALTFTATGTYFCNGVEKSCAQSAADYSFEIGCTQAYTYTGARAS